jgi:hypothetical protein
VSLRSRHDPLKHQPGVAGAFEQLRDPERHVKIVVLPQLAPQKAGRFEIPLARVPQDTEREWRVASLCPSTEKPGRTREEAQLETDGLLTTDQRSV